MNLKDTVKVGWELIKGDVSQAITKDGNFLIEPSTFRGWGDGGFANGGMTFFGDGREDERLFNYNAKDGPITAYKQCPPVSAIINRKAQAFVNGKTLITNIGGKAAGKESTSLFATSLRKLLNKPNIIQSGSQFEAQVYAMQQLYGYAVILAMKPYGFKNVDSTSLWLMPNWLIDFYYSRDAFYEPNTQIITRITLTFGGKVITLPLENILIIKDLTPCLDNPILPTSRILTLEMPINNVIGAYESRNTLINRRGPSGFITQTPDPLGSMPLSPSDKKEMQKEFMQYGLRRKQMQVILGGMRSMKFEKTGYNVAELGLMEEVTESGIAISTGLSYPPFLLGLSDTTYNNQKEASRGLYMETTIPESISFYQQLGSFFECAENGVEICKDYSHVSALQEDRQVNAQARKTMDDALEKEFKNNLITLDAWRVAIGNDPVGDEFGGMFYYQLIDLGWSFGNTTLNGGDNQATIGAGNPPATGK